MIKLPDISTLLAQILSARYGKDVRQSIHDSIKAINDASNNFDSYSYGPSGLDINPNNYTTQNFTDLNNIYDGKAYLILSTITNSMVKNMPEYGNNAFFISERISHIKGGDCLQIFSTLDKIYMRVKLSSFGRWIDVSNKSDHDIITTLQTEINNNCEKKTNKIDSSSSISDKSTNYPSVKYLETYYATSNECEKVANKTDTNREITDKSKYYPSLQYLENFYMTSSDISQKTTKLENDINTLKESCEKVANKTDTNRGIADKSEYYPSLQYLENFYTTSSDIAIKNNELKADIDKLEKEIAKSGFSVFNNKSPEWQTIHGASAWSFKPNSIYIAPASMQNNVITDLPSAAYLLGWPKMIITLGGDENSRPVSFTDTYATDRYNPEDSTPTGTFPFGGTIQILITEKRRWYRTKFGDVNGYSPWIIWGIDLHGNATASDFSNNLLSDITHNSIIRLNNASLVTDTPNNDKTSVTIETKSPNYTDTGDEKAIVQQAYYYRSDQSTDSIYVRISKASDGSYSPWEAYILSSNLESHIKQSEYIKNLEARIAALEKNN